MNFKLHSFAKLSLASAFVFGMATSAHALVGPHMCVVDTRTQTACSFDFSNSQVRVNEFKSSFTAFSEKNGVPTVQRRLRLWKKVSDQRWTLVKEVSSNQGAFYLKANALPVGQYRLVGRVTQTTDVPAGRISNVQTLPVSCPAGSAC